MMFKFGNYFDLFFRQFTTFADAVSVEQAQRYNVMLSFLDKKSFNIVACVDLSDSEKLNFNVALPKLKKAFCTSEIPASIELRFRKQLDKILIFDQFMGQNQSSLVRMHQNLIDKVIWFLAHNSVIFCPILIKIHIRVQGTTSYK